MLRFNYSERNIMRKIILALIFTLMSMPSISFADGHSGKISLAGFFVGDAKAIVDEKGNIMTCLLYTSPSPRDRG